MAFPSAFLLKNKSNQEYQYPTTNTLTQLSNNTSIIDASKVLFNNNGTRVFLLIVIFGVRSIRQYSLSIPYDTSSLILLPGEISLSSSGADFSIGGGGTKLILAFNDGVTREIRRYDMSTAWDLSTAILVQSVGMGDKSGAFINEEGTKLILRPLGGGSLEEYNLNTNFDLTTRSSIVFNLTLTSGSITVFFTDQGRVLYILDGDRNNLRRLFLTTGYDLSTATLDRTFNTSTYGISGTTSCGFTIGQNGSRFTLASAFPDFIKDFSLTTI